MSGGQAFSYVALSALAVGGWAVIGYGARKAWDRATRHGRRR